VPRTCSVCAHAQREAIDRALVAGESAPRIAALYRVSDDALLRHKEAHLPARLAQARDAAEVAQADDLLAQLRGLRSKAVAILLRAEAEGDLRTALAGIREARGCLELLAELEGELDRRAVVNVLVNHPEWIEAREVIFEVLRGHPAAYDALLARLAALRSLSNGH